MEQKITATFLFFGLFYFKDPLTPIFPQTCYGCISQNVYILIIKPMCMLVKMSYL